MSRRRHPESAPLGALPSLDQLAAGPARVQDLPADAAEKLLAQIHVVEGTLLARLLAVRAKGDGQPEAPAGRPLVVGLQEAAKMLGMTKDTLYRKWKCLGAGAYKDPADGKIKFSVAQLEAYIRRRAGK